MPTLILNKLGQISKDFSFAGGVVQTILPYTATQRPAILSAFNNIRGLNDPYPMLAGWHNLPDYNPGDGYTVTFGASNGGALLGKYYPTNDLSTAMVNIPPAFASGSNYIFNDFIPGGVGLTGIRFASCDMQFNILLTVGPDMEAIMNALPILPFPDPSGTTQYDMIGAQGFIYDNGPCVMLSEHNTIPLFIMDSTDGSFYNCFQPWWVGNANAIKQIVSIFDEVNFWNNTLVIPTDNSGMKMVQWDLTPYDPAAVAWTATVYDLQLSDPADDLIFQAIVTSINNNTRILGNTQKFFVMDFAAPGFPPFTAGTAFIIEKDFSAYTRVDITADGSQYTMGAAGSVVYYQDIDGGDWLIAPDTIANPGYASFGLLPTERTITTTLPLMQVFSLGCFSPCNNLATQFMSEQFHSEQVKNG